MKPTIGLALLGIITATVGTTRGQPARLTGQTTAGDGVSARPSPSLAERLGYKATDKLLIINVDHVGMFHAVNTAAFEGLEKGLATTATVMVPCGWFPEVVLYAKAHPEADFGIHLTHRDELQGPYRWAPVAGRKEVPGLFDPDGFFWTKPDQILAHSNPREAEIEGRAQIEKALAAGMDISHVDTHCGFLGVRPDYFAVYLGLAREFDMPLRFAGGGPENTAAGGEKALLDGAGILYPDYVFHGSHTPNESTRESWKRLLGALKLGVTEVYSHACISTAESQAALRTSKFVSLQQRVEDHEVFTSDSEIRKILEDQGVIRFGWKAIRDLQGKTRKETLNP